MLGIRGTPHPNPSQIAHGGGGGDSTGPRAHILCNNSCHRLPTGVAVTYRTRELSGIHI